MSEPTNAADGVSGGELDLDAMRGDPGPPPNGEDRTAEEYLAWAVRHWRHRARAAEAQVEEFRRANEDATDSLADTEAEVRRLRADKARLRELLEGSYQRPMPMRHVHIPDGDVQGGMLCYNNTGEHCDAWPRTMRLP